MVALGTAQRDRRREARQKELERRRRMFAPEGGSLTLHQISSLLAACRREIIAGIEPRLVGHVLSFVQFSLAPYAAAEQDFLDRITAGGAE